MRTAALSENMNGKICLVTGATNGIGKVAAQALAQMGATVLIVGRNAEKCAAVVNEIRQATGNQNVEALIPELSVMADVRPLAGTSKAEHSELDRHRNNAGCT